MGQSEICPECGTVLENGQTCQDYFHQMLFWEAENPGYGEVHPLTVLSYYLQHPGYYSPDGLETAKRLLREFLEEGITPQTARRRVLAKFGSGNRRPKITATENAKGLYQNEVSWRMTAADVVAKGATHYCDNVRKWSHSILETLKATGNF